MELEKNVEFIDIHLKTLLKNLKEKLSEVKKGGDLKELIELYKVLYDANDEIKQTTKELNKLQDSLKYNVIPEKMEEQDLKTVTFKELDCRITVSQVVRASIKPEFKERAYVWLRDEGLEDIIKETVNASTLSALAKDYIEKGTELPTTEFNVLTQDRVSLTKLKQGAKNNDNEEKI